MMSNREVVLGIDTSCYTTSVALLDLDGKLVEDRRKLLLVGQGKCGLAQSEMVFQHTRNLPELLTGIDFKNFTVKAIGATNKPRPLAESYMPAFLTGWGLARNLGQVLCVPVYPLSHQENHLEGGLWSAQGPKAPRFLMLHASGGTTDILLVEFTAEGKISLTTVGESIDLHAGQFVDRVGVALGLNFPCGPTLEKLAMEGQKDQIVLPVWVRENKVSFSGVCTKAVRLAQAGANKFDLALATEQVLGKAFGKVLGNICGAHKLTDVLLVGGVSANKLIREIVTKTLDKEEIHTFVPEPKYSGDGAVGAAYYALQKVRMG
jgi:N6-L-threonylcarbamoyladenine synthase